MIGISVILNIMVAAVGVHFCIEVTVFVGLWLVDLVMNHTVFLQAGGVLLANIIGATSG